MQVVYVRNEQPSVISIHVISHGVLIPRYANDVNKCIGDLKKINKGTKELNQHERPVWLGPLSHGPNPARS